MTGGAEVEDIVRGSSPGTTRSQPREAKFSKLDPIVDRRHPAITRIERSAYKRHGRILEDALAEASRQAPHLILWSEPAFAVGEAADRPAESDELSENAERPTSRTIHEEDYTMIAVHINNTINDRSLMGANSALLAVIPAKSP